MNQKVVNPIDKMFEYNLWANTQLITICSRLSDEQLEVEIDGVYGRIQNILAHLVSAEGYYVKRLSGKLPWADDLDWQSMTMDELLEKVAISGNKLIEIASQAEAAKAHRVELSDRTVTFFNWTVILQALYHGIEHRTQTKILLTQIGVEHPELAAWDYTESL